MQNICKFMQKLNEVINALNNINKSNNLIPGFKLPLKLNIDFIYKNHCSFLCLL